MSTTPTRRDVGRLGLGLGAAALSGRAALAQVPAFFRIGTGGTAGTYYPVGGLIANAISNPPQLVLTAQASNGSGRQRQRDRVRRPRIGLHPGRRRLLGLYGHGPVRGQGQGRRPAPLANLYPESIHLVAAKAANIRSVADLKGKRVSLDEPGSGTLVDARIILDGYGLKEKRRQGGLPEAEPGGREDARRRHGRVLLRRRLSDERHHRARRHRRRHRPRPDRRRRRPRRSASSTRSSPPTRSRPTPTRASAPSRPSPSARNG